MHHEGRKSRAPKLPVGAGNASRASHVETVAAGQASTKSLRDVSTERRGHELQSFKRRRHDCGHRGQQVKEGRERADDTVAAAAAVTSTL